MRNRRQSLAKNDTTSRDENGGAVVKQRQDINKERVVPRNELRAQVVEAVGARRLRKAKTRTNQKY